MHYSSNGKLLITGEYIVLDGAKALAIPTKFGQSLEVFSLGEPIIQWKSLDENNQVWFECELVSGSLQLINSSFYTDDENAQENTAETLQSILMEAQKLNPNFLADKKGFQVTTKLTFPRNWGLGSSSTLINNIANWAKVDAYKLLKSTFGGSGYDIACAQNNHPITYQLIDKKPMVAEVNFNPIFKNQLYFIYLNKKQNSREGIAQYKNFKGEKSSVIEEISTITKDILNTQTMLDFEKLIAAHEQIISKIIHQKPIQQEYFSDYFGQIKSLGAWGGDFILASGNDDTPNYFINKGYKTVVPFQEMIK
ncbi:MAG: GYDIA family GHMP kinase [Flavobacteriaceae bacterium]|nr:GYDIA family GHMP kinase [Flavobacteriaceae bacterium]